MELSADVIAEVDTQFITASADKIVERIEALPSCADLQGLVNDELAAAQLKIKAELDDLADMTTDYFKGLIDGNGKSMEMLQVLAEIPADIEEVIEWIKTLVGGYQKQLEEAIAALIQIPLEFARVTNALSGKIGALQNCVVGLPAVPVLPEMPELPEIPV